MTEETVTYLELKLPKSKTQKDKTNAAQKRREYPWHIIAASLGMLCFILLLAITGLIIHFQNSCKTVNAPERKNTSSTEDHNHSNMPTYTEKDCDIRHGWWFCCRRSCYYFSIEQRTWNESKKSCQKLGYNLIKIDDEEEQKFIQSKIIKSYWVGLHRKGTNHPWLWQDGTTPSWRLHFQPSTSTSETCGRIMKTDMINIVCTTRLHYICEKPSI